jgi:hypothetical protein
MSIYREEEAQNCSFLISAVDKDEWPASYPSYSNFWGKSHRLDPKAASLDMWRRGNSCSYHGIKPQFLSHPPYSLDFMSFQSQ